jgi:hypothetical protein
MKHFILQDTTLIPRKDGTKFKSISYFGRHDNRVLAFNLMESEIEKAKKYTNRADALIDKRKYFYNRSSIKIISVKS